MTVEVCGIQSKVLSPTLTCTRPKDDHKVHVFTKPTPKPVEKAS